MKQPDAFSFTIEIAERRNHFLFLAPLTDDDEVAVPIIVLNLMKYAQASVFSDASLRLQDTYL